MIYTPKWLVEYRHFDQTVDLELFYFEILYVEAPISDFISCPGKVQHSGCVPSRYDWSRRPTVNRPLEGNLFVWSPAELSRNTILRWVCPTRHLNPALYLQAHSLIQSCHELRYRILVGALEHFLLFPSYIGNHHPK